MILLDLFATFIEDFLMTYFLFSYFNIKSKVKLILLTILTVLETFIFNNIIINNTFLLISLFFTFVGYLVIEYKKITFLYLFIPIVLMGLLLLSNAIALSLVSFIFNISMNEVSLNHHYMIVGVLLSRILFILLTIIFYRIIKKDTDSFNVRRWWIMGIFILIIFIMLATILQALIFNIISIHLIYSILFELILLIGISFYLYYIIQKQNKDNVKMTQQIIKNEYQKKMYDLMNKMNNQIIVDKHMMMYNLINIDILLSANNHSEAKEFVKKEINKLLKYKYLSSTHNELFDYEITKKVNELKDQNIDVKTLFNIGHHNEILNQDSVVRFLVNCIDKVSEDINIIDKIELFIEEKDQYIIFKMTILSNDIERLKHKCLFKETEHITYHMKEKQDFIEISFLLK